MSAYVAEAFFFAAAGRPVIDEGVYLNAGRLVFDGQLPYRDFPFSQGPLIAYVYGAVMAVFGPGLWPGRLLSFALGIGAFIAALSLVRHLGGRIAVASFVLLSMMNLPLLWVSGTVRTQSLSTPLTLLGAMALALPRRSVFGQALAPSLLLWSTSARLTNVLAFAAVALLTAHGLRGQWKRLAWVAGIVGLQGLIAFAPALAAPRAALFHIVTAQLGRADRSGMRAGSLADALAAKLGIFLQPETSFLAIIGLALLLFVGLIAGVRRGFRPDWARPFSDPGSAQLALMGLALLVFLPHLLLDRGFLTYFVTSSALLVPALAIGISSLLRDRAPLRAGALAAVAVLLGVGLISAPRQLPAWIGSGDASFAHFQQVARELRSLAPDDCTIVTMETALAVEAGCRVLPGLEYSLFSIFPRLSDREASDRGVVNGSILAARVEALRPELIVIGPRGRSALGLGAARDEPPSLGRLAPTGYRYVERHRIPSGAFLRNAPDVVAVDVFVREAS